MMLIKALLPMAKVENQQPQPIGGFSCRYLTTSLACLQTPVRAVHRGGTKKKLFNPMVYIITIMKLRRKIA